MKFKIVLVFLICVFMFNCVSAQENIAYSRLSLNEDHLVGEVCIRDYVVFRIHQDGNYDTEARCQEIAGRINNIYSLGMPVSEITVELNYKKSEENGKEDKKIVTGAVLYWGEAKIIEISSLQARLNNSTPEELSRQWVDNLKTALKASAIFKVFPRELLLAPGESGDVKIIGNMNGPVEWKVNSGTEVISVSSSAIPDRLTVKALSVGDAAIEIKKGEVFTLNIMVRDFAAEVLKPEEILVSGKPASGEFIKNAVLREANRFVSLRPGAVLSLDPLNVNSPSLLPGEETIISVPFKAGGTGLKDVQGVLTFKVKNVEAKFEEPLMFFMSNSPEKITTDGVLFSHSLSPVSPVRLMCYHINAGETDKWIMIDLVNSSSSPEKVWLLSGFGGPSPYEAYTGQIASVRFLRNREDGAGQFYTVPPMSRVSVYTQRLAPKQIINSICHFQFSSQSELDVVVRAQSSPGGPPVENLLPPGDVATQCRGIYSTPQVFINQFYQVGDPEASIYIGKAPFLVDMENGVELYGNYGVLYDIVLQLKNPTDRLRDIDLTFTSQGGIAQGTFLIDGVLVETPVVRSSERVPFVTFLLKPGEERIINIKTIPQGGSHYPVRIVIKG